VSRIFPGLDDRNNDSRLAALFPVTAFAVPRRYRAAIGKYSIMTLEQPKVLSAVNGWS